jgi:predicted DNA-binding transcriptional regulator AlpA
MDETLLDIHQVIKILNCSKKHFEQQLIRKGFPEPIYIARVRYWFRKDIDCYLYMLQRHAFDELSHQESPPPAAGRQQVAGGS